MKPLLSICILNWNTTDTVLESIRRIHSQTKRTTYEIMVWDQNSDDNPDRITGEFPSVLFLQSEVNVGNSISRNIMVRNSNGEYIMFLDGDITVINNSIDIICDYLKSNPEINTLGYNPSNCSPDREIETHPEIFSCKPFHSDCFLSQYSFSKKSFLQEFPFPEFYPYGEEGWGSEDSLVGIAMESNGHELFFINDCTYKHNRHSSWLHLDAVKMQRMTRVRIIFRQCFHFMLNAAEQKEVLQKQNMMRFI